ncbi:MAG: hypoxanthine phosphoribosyltransferase [Bdellovibrio sp.]|nr:MAG: hypoxanthine phosphoribosyltransferase [Bdellovibrio sp.]
MKNLRGDLVPFMKSEEIHKVVRNLARQIEMDYEGKEIIFICPLRGSIHLMADLAREVRLPQQIEFVHMKAGKKGGTISVIKDIGIDIAGKNVIIVEEIIDSGRTLIFLRDRLLLGRPASLRILTLLDKPARRDLPIQADYIGKVIDDRYIVGYGMDSEESGRHFPDIYFLAN